MFLENNKKHTSITGGSDMPNSNLKVEEGENEEGESFSKRGLVFHLANLLLLRVVILVVAG